jgi:zinc/manganese transport system substrate-binding protein
MTFRRWTAGVVLVCTGLLGGCGPAEEPLSNRIDVVVTTSILGDVTSAIVGEAARVSVLIPVGTDPHEFQASARQVAEIQGADLVVALGLGLEHGLISVLETVAEDGANVLYLGPLLDPIPLESSDSLDPHVWLDPVRMDKAIGLIVSELDVLDPSVDWGVRGDTYSAELALAETEVEILLGSLPGERRKLVTNHDSLRYLAARYGFELIGVVVPGGSTLGAPSSEQLAHLVDVLTSEDVLVIFAETTQPAALAEIVADEVGEDVEVVTLYTGSLGEPGTDAGTYLGMLRVNAERIANALAG